MLTDNDAEAYVALADHLLHRCDALSCRYCNKEVPALVPDILDAAAVFTERTGRPPTRIHMTQDRFDELRTELEALGATYDDPEYADRSWLGEMEIEVVQ